MMDGTPRPASKLFFPLLLILALLVVACGGPGTNTTNNGPSQPAKAAPDKQIFVRPIEGISALDTLDPAQVTDVYSGLALGMSLMTLTQIDNNNKVVPLLITGFTTSSDNLDWTFKLRPDIKFNDGTQMTSDDVVFSLNRLFQPETQAFFAPVFLGNIKDTDAMLNKKIKTLIGDSLLAPDSLTVVIKTSKPTPFLLSSLSSTFASILEKSFVEKYGKDFTKHYAEGSASGPWIFQPYEHGKPLVFTPNKYYFGKKPQLQKVVMPFYPQTDTSWRAFRANQVSRALVPIADIAEAKGLPNGQYHQIPSLSIYYYSMNYRVKPFDNIKIMQAFDLAINKDAIAKNIYKGTVIGTNHIVPEGALSYNPDLTGPAGQKGTAGNPALALQLFNEGLQEENLTRATLPPIIIQVSNTGNSAFAQELAAEQDMWQRALNISVKIEQIDFNKLVDELNNTINNSSLMAWGIGWSGIPDPQNWTSAQFSKGSINNSGNYGQNSSNDADAQLQTQQLMAQADANFDQAARIQQYQKAEQQLVNDVAWLPIYQSTVDFVLMPCVVGYVGNSGDYIVPDDWGNIYISTQAGCANTSQYQ